MEQVWNRGGRNPPQTLGSWRRRKWLEQAENLRYQPPQLPLGAHGKEGSPFESARGLCKKPRAGGFCFGSICRSSNMRQVRSPYGAQVESRRARRRRRTIGASVPGASTTTHEQREISGYVTRNTLNPGRYLELMEQTSVRLVSDVILDIAPTFGAVDSSPSAHVGCARTSRRPCERSSRRGSGGHRHRPTRAGGCLGLSHAPSTR